MNYDWVGIRVNEGDVDILLVGVCWYFSFFEILRNIIY